MKKKTWTIILIILAVLGIACAVYFIWFHDYKTYYNPEIDEPEVFHDIEFDADLIPGLWKENELYYRYDESGTGVTWDLADDVMEDEGTEIDWELEGGTFTHYYHMEIGGVIPKSFNMKVLELDYMEYEDDYGVNHKFNKVQELELL